MSTILSAKAADGGDIFFEMHGDRSNPAIFMGPHFYLSRSEGEGKSTETWIERLRREFCLIVADYPRGIGRTPNPPGLSYSPDMAVREIESIADAAQVDRFGWVGYSYGAAIGVQVACRTDRVTALALGGFPPLNAPFRLMAEALSELAQASPPLPNVDPRTLWTAAGFYLPLAAWPELAQISSLTIPRLVFMGDQDAAQGMPEPWSVPLAERLRAAEDELRELGWQIHWLERRDHRSAMQGDTALTLVQKFFRDSLYRDGAIR
jgi:pimeloyl-ACP methyl ester carboxylesterase